MCVAIIEVKYQDTPGSSEMIRSGSEPDFETRFEALKNAPGVVRLTVYRPESTFTKQVLWEETK